MDRVVDLHRKVAPELLTVIEERYNILRYVRYAQPVGRRSLASALGIGERGARAHVDFLKNAGLIDFSPLGMTITRSGLSIVDELAEYVRTMHGLSELEQELEEALGLRRVIIVRGDSESEGTVQQELGRAAAGVLAQYLGNNMTIAISGGSTMAMVADGVNFCSPTTTVVPARGALGEQIEYQSNTIAAVLAAKLGGRHRLLHIPDGMVEETLEVILAKDANVRSVAHMIKQADILLSGIGQATAMGLRWGLEADTIERLESLGAVGETLGHYFNLEGKVVYKTSSVGLHLSDLAGIKHVIAVAGGRRKAEAIAAVAVAGGQHVLVTDEAAARAIQEFINIK